MKSLSLGRECSRTVAQYSILFLIGLLLSVSSNARAEEPIEEFLTALQERRYYDVAISYVDRISKTDLAPRSFKEEAEYRRGMLIVDAARVTRNSSMRNSQLDQAKEMFERFVKAHPKHPSAALARSQLGNILVERARGLMKQAKNDPANQDSLTQQAASIYAEAYDSLTTSKTEIGEQIKAMAGRRDEAAIAAKGQYVKTYLAIARVLFEQAETVKNDDKQYAAKLTEAAKVFDEIASKYRSRGAGVYALLFEGECYQLMGQEERALTYYKELLQNEDQSLDVRKLKSQALAKSIECWLKAERNAGPDRAIKTGESWWKNRRPSEGSDASWLEFRLAMAKAYRQKSQIETKEKQADRALASAREIARELAKRRSPVQRDAQTLLVSLGGNAKHDSGSAAAESSATFVEARDAAMKSLDEMKLANATIKILSSQLKNIREPARREKMQTDLAAAKQKVAELSGGSIELFEQAVALSTDADTEDLAGVRYYLAYLYYQQERYRHAAVLAGFVTRHQTDAAAAKECANVALAARQRLYQVLPPENRARQGELIADLAEIMINKWPGHSASDTALMTLLDVTVQRGDVAKAEEYLARIPTNAPKRASAEMRIGQAIWREYLLGLKNKSPEPELSQLKTRAQKILADGVSRFGNMKPDESAIRAALSLAQIYADSGQAKKALELLNRTRLGALNLVENASAWVDKIPGLKIEAYKTAIRAYVSTADDASGDSIDTAQALMRRLQDELKQQPNGEEKMIAIYVSLARDLERQLTIASPKSRRAMSRGFESFLRGAAEGTKDIAVLNWVGATFYGLGNGMLQGNNSSPEAQRYFGEAASAYRKVLDMVKSDPSVLSENALTQVKVNQAKCLRQLGKYKESVDLFANVLNKKNRVLNIQIEAAKTLQQLGTREPQGYWKAIYGDLPGSDGKNAIWGWGKIANLVAKNETYRNTFHQARYNVALSRYRYALASSGAKKKEMLLRARADIVMTQKLFNLGSKRQKQRYENLLKLVQKELGEKQVGFGETK